MKISDAQPLIWDQLSKARTKQKIGTAYLFSGQNGSAKEWLAIEFSKLLNCDLNDFLSCNSCPSCMKFSKLQHENLNLIFPLPSMAKSKNESDPIKNLSKDDFDFVINAVEQKSKDPFHKINVPKARRITIDSIRFLRKSLYLKSQASGRKIVIIFDAHLLAEGGGESANALLKMLEEPPGNTSLILVTSNKSKLPLTIISRCQQIDFPGLPLDIARKLLENNGVENSKAMQLAFLSNGNIILAKDLLSRDINEPLLESQQLIENLIKLDQKSWRSQINDFSMMAFRSPQEFIFRINLIQMWINIAYKFKCGEELPMLISDFSDSFNEFNNQFPKANYFEINALLEESIEALSRNLYMPLFMLNMMITIQTLLKGKEPKIIV